MTERIVPETKEFEQQYAQHIVRYREAKPLMTGARCILDCACGTGYGTDFLSDSSLVAVGTDFSFEAVAYAKQRYGRRGVYFLCADAQRLPFKSGAVDVVISFETLEHLPQPESALREYARVLRTDGQLMATVPDKAEDPVGSNLHHLNHWDGEEFRALLARVFAKIELSKLLFQGQRRFKRPGLAALTFPGWLKRLVPAGLKDIVNQRRRAAAPAQEEDFRIATEGEGLVYGWLARCRK